MADERQQLQGCVWQQMGRDIQGDAHGDRPGTTPHDRAVVRPAPPFFRQHMFVICHLPF